MAGPLVFWPNRKSKLGLQRSSHVTKRTQLARWFTTPPVISAEEVMLNEQRLIESNDTTKLHAMLKNQDSIIKEQAGLIEKLQEVNETRRTVCDELERLAKKAAEENDRLAPENARLVAENETKTADLRKLRKEIDPDEIKLRIMYAIDAATSAKDATIAELRAELQEKSDRIAELERSKKRLREALARLSEAT